MATADTRVNLPPRGGIIHFMTPQPPPAQPASILVVDDTPANLQVLAGRWKKEIERWDNWTRPAFLSPSRFSVPRVREPVCRRPLIDLTIC